MFERDRVIVYTLILFAFVMTDRAYAKQDFNDRTAALEKRVAKLERIVLELREAQTVTCSARTLRASIETIPVPESSGPEVTQVTKALPQELLPNLGKIGAVANFTAGWNAGSFGLHGGSALGGSLQLPLANIPGGRLAYEFSVALAQSARQLPVTSNVAQVANLAVLGALRPNQSAVNLQEALSGTGAAPFAVTQDAKWQAQLLQVVPFALKYDWTRLDRFRIRPYAVVGLGAYVTTSHQTTTSGLRANASLDNSTLQTLQRLFQKAPFTGPLIGGQITSSAEMQTRGLPSGQGSTDIGIQAGGGVDWLFPSGLTLGLDARFNRAPDGPAYHVLATRWGWRF